MAGGTRRLGRWRIPDPAPRPRKAAHHVSMPGRFLPARGSGGGVDSRDTTVRTREPIHVRVPTAVSVRYSEVAMTLARSPKPHPTRMVAGIEYEPGDQRAFIAGTGLEVWEIIEVYRINPSAADLRRNFDWLSAEQLDAALAFAKANPGFLAVELAAADAAIDDLAALWERHPQTKPPHLR